MPSDKRPESAAAGQAKRIAKVEEQVRELQQQIQELLTRQNAPGFKPSDAMVRGYIVLWLTAGVGFIVLLVRPNAESLWWSLWGATVLLLLVIGAAAWIFSRDEGGSFDAHFLFSPTVWLGLLFIIALGAFSLLKQCSTQPARPEAEFPMAESAPAETRRILEAFRQGPDFGGLSEVPALELPVIENPGRQAEIDAALVASVERSPVGTEHDRYRQFLQTLPWCSSAFDDCWGSESRRAFQALVELPSTAAWFASGNGRVYIIRRWIQGDVSIVLIGRFSEDLQEAAIAQLILPLGPGGLTFGEENIYSPGLFSLSELPDGSLLLSLDKGARCQGERRDGVMVRLSPNLEEFVWASPLRVSGGGFAYNEARIFAVDGGTCETDYLYELDLDTGQVVSRTRVPSGDAFVALDGNDLYLVLYNRFMHYRLN